MGLAVLNNRETHSLSKVKHIIAVGAGKGGVGKSSVTINLALALNEMGYKVGILDADIYGPSVHKMLGEETLPTEENGFIVPARSKNICYISLSFFQHVVKSSVVRAPIANQIIEQFIHKTGWGELDFLLVDFPPGTGDIQLTLLQQLPFSFALCVTTPQQVSLLDVKKAVDMFIRMNVEIFGVIENMSYLLVEKQRLYPFGKDQTCPFCEQYGLDYLGEIPIDPQISRCCDEAESLFSGDSSAKDIFIQLSQKIKKKISGEKKKGSFNVEWHLNRKSFVVTFPSGSSIVGRASKVQKLCPCIKCQGHPQTVEEDVWIKEISLIGNYGLKFAFSSGCSKGIYTFDRLKKL